MTAARDVWGDERSSVECGRAIVASVLVLGIVLGGSAFLEARDDLHERMKQRYKVAEPLERMPEPAAPRLA